MHLDAPLLEMQHRHLAIAPRFTMHEQARTVAATEHHYEEVWRPQGNLLSFLSGWYQGGSQISRG